jgi:hypothetical protein
VWFWGVALAADAPAGPTWSVGAGAGPWVVVATPNETVSTDFDVAFAARAAVAFRPPVWFSAELPLGIADGGLRWGPRAQVELLSPGTRFRPAVTAGATWQGASSTDPTVTSVSRFVPHWGLSAAVATGRGPWVRLDLRHTVDTTDRTNPLHHALGLLGLEWYPGRAAPVAVPAPVPVVAAPAPPPPPAPVDPGFIVSPAVDVWISHPICAWVPSTDAPALLAGAPGPVTVVAEGYLPVVVDPAHLSDLVLTPVPPGGAVIVAAQPGDHVFVDGVATPVGPDGAAVAATRAGEVEIRVEGGGRRSTVALAPADGWGVWYRAPAHKLVEVRFPAGSAEPGPEVREQVAQLVALAGDRRYRLQGSWSPEGRAEANRVLADERAERVRALLVEAGLDGARIELLPAQQLESTDPAAARVVLVSSAAPETP